MTYLDELREALKEHRTRGRVAGAAEERVPLRVRVLLGDAVHTADVVGFALTSYAPARHDEAGTMTRPAGVAEVVFTARLPAADFVHVNKAAPPPTPAADHADETTPEAEQVPAPFDGTYPPEAGDRVAGWTEGNSRKTGEWHGGAPGDPATGAAN
jgi:hypothetical protein